MSRILHVYSGNLFGGIEALLLTLAGAEQLESGVHSDYALCFEGRLSRELEHRGARVHGLGEVKLRQPLSVVRARRRLRALVEGGEYDIVICHSVWAQALFGPVVRRAGRPLGIWLHDVATGRHWLERLARRVVPDLVVANSHFTAGTVERLYPGHAPVVLHCPVAPAPHLDPSERSAVRREIGTNADRVVFIQVGRMDPLKGHAVLLDACAELAADARWECWIVGGVQRSQEASYLEGLQERSRKLGLSDRVRFLGERRDVPRLLGGADIFCQPNVRPEAFGIAIVEAMYAGLPVVASRLGGAIESLSAGGGLLVASGDSAALAAALRSLLDDPQHRAALSAGNPGRARALCDPSQQLRQLDAAVTRWAERGQRGSPRRSTIAGEGTTAGGLQVGSRTGMQR